MAILAKFSRAFVNHGGPHRVMPWQLDPLTRPGARDADHTPRCEPGAEWANTADVIDRNAASSPG